jgi:hypothetical protein
MPVIQLEAQLTIEELLKAVEQLSTPDLEAFVDRVLAIQAQRHWPSLSEGETALLRSINQSLPMEIRDRYEELVRKRETMSLTAGEQEEMVRLSDQLEIDHARRMEKLLELARLRQVPVESLMQELGIPPRSHA